MVDRRVAGLNERKSWIEDSVLAPQRCRLFLLVRFPHLPHPFEDEVLSRELSRGEERLCRMRHAKRILRDLSGAQRNQLAGLLLDIDQALRDYARYGRETQMVRDLATGNRRLRVLSRRVIKIRSELSGLIKYTKRLHPVLQSGCLRSAERCLEILDTLRVDASFVKFYLSQLPEYPPIDNPEQLGIVQLYWFFKSECKCSGAESEVRAALVTNELKIDPKSRPLRCTLLYREDESKGSPAVRLAVTRFRPRTIE